MRQERRSHLFIRLTIKFTLTLTLLFPWNYPWVCSLAVASLPRRDRYVRSQTAHLLISCRYPSLWCTRANAWRNRPHVRYPIITQRDRSWAKSSNSHRWSPQECSHASHSTSVRWYSCHLRPRHSPKELKNNRDKVHQLFFSLDQQLTWRNMFFVILGYLQTKLRSIVFHIIMTQSTTVEHKIVCVIQLKIIFVLVTIIFVFIRFLPLCWVFSFLQDWRSILMNLSSFRSISLTCRPEEDTIIPSTFLTQPHSHTPMAMRSLFLSVRAALLIAWPTTWTIPTLYPLVISQAPTESGRERS